jgi:uncharacterized protein (UPF0210 family)
MKEMNTMNKIKWQRQDTPHLFIDVYKQEDDEPFFSIAVSINGVSEEIINKGLKAREIVEMVLPDMDFSDFRIAFNIPGNVVQHFTKRINYD